MIEMPTYCCVCGIHLRGPKVQPDEPRSHGYCDTHLAGALKEIVERQFSKPVPKTSKLTGKGLLEEAH